MDAAKGCFGLLALKSIFSKMAQKWPKNCIFSNFPLIFLMVIGEIPQLEEDLYFSLIGRKKLFTAGRVGSLLPPGKHAQNTGSALKKGET